MNTPSSEKSPDWLAGQALAIARERGLRARVWDESALAEAGFAGVLAVAAGSHRPLAS